VTPETSCTHIKMSKYLTLSYSFPQHNIEYLASVRCGGPWHFLITICCIIVYRSYYITYIEHNLCKATNASVTRSYLKFRGCDGPYWKLIGRCIVPHPKPRYRRAGEKFWPHVALSDWGIQHVDTHWCQGTPSIRESRILNNIVQQLPHILQHPSDVLLWTRATYNACPAPSCLPCCGAPPQNLVSRMHMIMASKHQKREQNEEFNMSRHCFWSLWEVCLTSSTSCLLNPG